MLDSIVRALQIPELKKRIQFLLLMFAVYVLGTHVPVPGVNADKIQQLFGGGNLLGLMNIFSGGALARMSIFALGIVPYINASIIMQMMSLAIPRLEELSKEGDAGRREIAKITRWLTVLLAFLQAIGFSLIFRQAEGVLTYGYFSLVQIWVVWTAGSTFLLWMGEEITDKGIGNGVSLVIFASIMTALPYQLGQIGKAVQGGLVSYFAVFVLLVIFVFTVWGIVLITQGERRIPIQHAKRVIGMRVQQGGGSFLPIKVNTAGVMPIIFALSIVMFPATILNSIPNPHNLYWLQLLKNYAMLISPGYSWWGAACYVLFIIVFTFFYTSVVLSPKDLADNLKKYGNMIPGIRPGTPTFDYLDRVISRITFAGGVFLAVVALIQYLAPEMVNITQLSIIGGTSLLIVVGVAIETMQAIEAQLLMRNYEGFIKSSGMAD